MPKLPEIFSPLRDKAKVWRSELEEAWRQGEMELASDAYGYRLYREMEAGKLTTEEFMERIDSSQAEFGFDLVHVRYGAQYAKEHPPREVSAKK